MAGCAGTCAFLVVLVAVPLGLVLQQMSRFGLAPAGVGISYYASRAIRSGTGQEWYGKYVGVNPLEDTKRAVRFSIEVLFGNAFLNSDAKVAGFALPSPQDPEGKFCTRLLDYMWVSPKVSGLTYPSVYADAADVADWVQACRSEYARLSEEERQLLGPFHAAGAIPSSVLIPGPTDHGRILQESRHVRPTAEETVKMGRAQIEDLVRQSLASSLWAPEVPELPADVVAYYEALNLRVPNRVPASLDAIGRALRAGEIAVFDATPLLPKELFNVSMTQLADWEGPDADRIVVWGDGSKASSLRAYANDRHAFLAGGVPKEPFSLAQLQAVTGKGEREGIFNDTSAQGRVYSKLASMPVDKCKAGYVHTRRLPQLHRRLPDVVGPSGLQDDVLRAESMLWLGPTPGGFHYDEEANIYVQMSGETDMILVPQNFTDAAFGAKRHLPGLPTLADLRSDEFLKEVPIYILHLVPGQGVTLPGRTFHRFMAQTHDRIALNWFFIPGWRKMEYTEADWYAQEAKASLTRLALRQIWARTFTRLYEETGKGVIFMGSKLEYL